MNVQMLYVSLWVAGPAIGTWKLNIEKSKYSPGPPPKSVTITYSEAVGGIKRTGESIETAGIKTSFEYTAKYDGKDYPVTGSDVFDAIMFKRISDHTVQGTLKKSGKVVSPARQVVPQAGKVMTLTITGTNAKG